MPPKKKGNRNIEELRILTRRQKMMSEKLQRENEELRYLVRLAEDYFKAKNICPSDWCKRTGSCEWCQKIARWMED